MHFFNKGLHDSVELKWLKDKIQNCSDETKNSAALTYKEGGN